MVLQAVQQDVQVKGSHVVAHQDIGIQAVQACNEVAQQGTLAGLHRQHAASVALAQLTLVALLHRLLKPCMAIARVLPRTRESAPTLAGYDVNQRDRLDLISQT